MQFFLRWNDVADTVQLLFNALDLISCGFTLLGIQLHGGGPSQPPLRAAHNAGNHLQVPQ
jgi:hypothetical protein